MAVFWLLAGCTAGIDQFKAQVVETYPLGSEVSVFDQDMERLGFKPAKFSGQHDGRRSCKSKSVAYGFWAGGQRYVCYQSANGLIEEIEVFELVAGL
ncbi:hypothetical protein [Shimia sp.]|uniref:hypothetical protein n=1 Tax=Shimia sp. TaxID=1954381 RepID=UPI003B8BB525